MLGREAEHFFEIQRKYYNDELDDKELANEVTQPFWQSMRLTKKRLQSKGLRMDIPVWSISKKGEDSQLPEEKVCQDGSDIIGSSIREVKTHRSFWQGDKKIYSKKEREYCAVHTLKANVREEEAACPNCGHVGKIADYIDGCDYCGSVFTVNDFETKISGFFLEENIKAKVQRLLGTAAIFCGIFAVLLLLLTIVSFAGIVYMDMSGGNDKGLALSAITMIHSANMIPIMWKTITGLVVASVMAGSLLLWLFPRQITGENIVKSLIPEFSAQDFLQNLEYKLRNIHFADKVAEIEAFASCNMQAVVEKYGDVVECNMRKLHFTDVRQDAEKYYLNAAAELKLSLYDGRRIHNKYEQVKLSISGKKEVFLKNTLAIREYKCPGCHSSVALLEGGKCNYCGAKLDYENYSWLIDGYESKIPLLHSYQWIKLGFIGIFLIVLLYNILTTDVVDDELVGLYEQVSQAEQAINGFFEAVFTPEELGMNVQLESLEEEGRYRYYYYAVDDGAEAAKTYRKKLVDVGYIYDTEHSTEKQYDIYMPVEYQGEKGYIKIRVSSDAKHLIVEMNTVEFIGQ